MKKHLWTWEKHNILRYIQNSKLKTFTCEDLIKSITRTQFYYGYTHKIVSNFLFELERDGHLTVTYVSQGSRTVPVYTYKSI